MKLLKILHTADWHIGEFTGPVVDGQNARELDTLKCIDFLIETAEKEAVDMTVIAGDLFDKSKLWGDTMLRLIDLAADRLRKLAAIAPTVLLFGTANHDSMKAFLNIEKMQIPNLFIITKPELINVEILIDACANKYMTVQVGGVPGYDKGYFRAKNPGMSAEEENQMCSKMLGDIVLGLSSQINPEYPSILMSHYTVVGCQLENGEHIFQQSDVVLPKDALQASDFDMVCLGHIHRHQPLMDCGVPTYYSGPPNGLTFNEEGQEKGFLIHEYKHREKLEPYKPVVSRFIKTPSRRFHTQVWDEQDVDMFIHGYPISDFAFKDAIVRLHYTCSDELNKQLNRKALEKALYDAGAFYVSEIRPTKLIETLKKEILTETAGPVENLVDWLKVEGFEDAEIAVLVELAKPMIATVSAKMPTGKLSGIFVPKSLKVKNYRSYKEEFFDFSQVYFAIVSGANGVGKSAFFGDAVRDCLFEETREGDLTGWINNDPSVKSGVIEFIFGMGETNWRVVRTRAKSGKVTLSLAELVNGEWADRSSTKKDDTQNKIVALMGMDNMTLSSCALIMQDAYGLFLEADKENRMLVLGNLLGLSIYDQLTDLAKIKVTEINRSMEKTKTKLADLDENLKDKPEVEVKLQTVNMEIDQLLVSVQAKEKALSELETVINNLTMRVEKGKELHKQITELANQVALKNIAKSENQVKQNQATLTLSQETKILENVAEYEKVKQQVTVLETKQPRLNELKVQISDISNEVANKEILKAGHKVKVDQAEEILSREPQILENVAEHERVKQQITVLEIKQPRLNEIYDENNKNFNDLINLNNEVVKIEAQIKDIEVALADKPALEQAVIEYRETLPKLSGMDDLEKKYNDFDFKLRQAESNFINVQNIYDASKISFETKINTLSGKTEMLANSNCIDYENAKCEFLADAQAAKIELDKVRADYELLTTKEVDDARVKRDEISKQMIALKYDPAEHKRLKDLITELRPKSERAAELSGKDELLTNLQTQRTQLVTQIDAIKVKSDSLATELTTLNNELEPLDMLKKQLPVLAKSLTDKEQLPVSKETLKNSNQEIVSLDTEIANKKELAKKIESEVAIINSELVALPSLNSKLFTLQAALLLKEQLPVAKEVVKTTTEVIATLDLEITNINEQIRTMELEVYSINAEQPKLVELQLQANVIDREIKELQVSQNNAHSRAGALKAQIGTFCRAQQERDAMAEEMEPTAKELVRHTVLSTAFGLDGIPFSIVRSVVPELSAMANDILGQMTGGQMTMEMRTERIQKSNKKEVNALEIWITDYQRGSLPYKSRSGGQKVKSALSVAFALADLKARRAGIQLGMMFVDEPPFLDADGTEAYCDALELLGQRYENMMVIAISHDPAMKARFPQEIIVEDTGEGGSKVRLVT